MTLDDYVFYRNVDMKSLVAFIAEVDLGGGVPAASSVQLARLCQQYPVTLFTRESRRLELTIAGKILHRRLSRTLSKLRRRINVKHLN